MTNYIVASKVREYVGGEFRISAEFLEELDAVVEDLVIAAIERAQANGRVTVKPYDVDPELEGEDEPRVIRKSAVAEVVKDNDARMSAEAYTVLNELVLEIIDKAMAAAEANGRKTLKPQDIFF
jgi:histone H3/H4